MPSIKRTTERPWIKERKAFDAAPGAVNKFYHSTHWRKLRALFLKKHPICNHCQNKDIITKATTVDHIVSINPNDGWNTENGKYPHPLNTDNLQALCFKCHARKTGKTTKN